MHERNESGRKTIRQWATALTALVVTAGSLLVPISTAGAAEQLAGVDVTRFGGADRYATSLIAAEAVAAHAGGSLDSVVMVSGQSWTAAVVAAPLAGFLETAVLATPPDALRADAEAFLQRTGVSHALIIGAASESDGVGAEVETALKELGITVERIVDAGRYETSVAAARRLGKPGNLGDMGSTAIIASGEVFADALVAGTFAARGSHPVLLTPPAMLHPDVADYLRSVSVRHVVIMGGRGALHKDVEDAVTSLGIEVTRLEGKNRYETAVKAAGLVLGSYGDDCFTSQRAGLARASIPFDSFSAAPLLALLCAPLLLADRDLVPSETAGYLSEARASAASSGVAAVELRVFGGEAAVSQASVNGYISGGAVSTSGPLETVDYSRIDGLLSSVGALDATEGCPDAAVPAVLNDQIEIVRIVDGCVVIEYEPLNGRTLAQARGDLAQDATVVAVDLPFTGYGVTGPYDYTTGDPDAGRQWFLPMFDAKALWDGWPAAADVTVAVIDSGVDASHADLSGSVVTTGNSCHRRDLASHGTHVAGIVAAEAGNGIALAGIAPRAKLLSVKLPLGNAPFDSECAREIWTASQAIQRAVEQGADVINMSFGRPWVANRPFPTTLDTVIHLAAASDVVLVAAAGNRGNRLANRNAREIPASHADVIAVAATTQGGTRAAFSTSNRWVDIAAPGKQIYSTVPCKPPEGCAGDDNNGTSMAAPMISGIVAHLKARYPQASAVQIRQALLSTALQPGSTQPGVRTDDFGWGIVQPHAAISALGAAVGAVPAPPAVSNSAPRFTSPVSATVRENATHVLSVTAVDDDPQDDVSTYGITAGADHDAFEMDAVGNLAFTRAPDYDSPGDADGDNVYDVVLSATSGSIERLLTSTQNVRVTVTDDKAEVPPSPLNQRFAFEGSSIVLSWDAVAGATFYRVYYDDFFGSSCRVRAGGSTSFCELLEGNVRGTSYTHASPDPGDNYYWVAACNSSGCSQIDGERPARSAGTVPAAPDARFAFEGSSIVLSWDAVAGATFYRVYYDDFFGSSCRVRAGGSTSFCELLEGNVRGTSYTHASPDPGDNYYWVAACNSSGCSQIDGERPARSAGTVPAAPDARFAFEGSSIVLSWDAVAGATFYRVYYDDFFGSSCRVRAGGSTSFCELLEGNVRGTSYTHASPDPGENYYWVAACNSSGCSQIDGERPARSAGTVPAAPDARFAFEGSSIVLSWDAVAGATFYRVYYDDFFGSSCRVRAGGSTSFCELLEGNVRGTSYTHASPDPGDNYYWVAACNSSGCSQIDGERPARSAGTVPAAPDARFAFEGSSIVLSWDAVAGATFYRVYYDDFFGSSCRVRAGGSTSFCELLEGNVRGTSYTHASPDPGDNYYWVAACNSSGCSQIDGERPARSAGTVPAAPDARFAFEGSSIVLSWDAVAGATFYRVYYDDFFGSSCRVRAGGSTSFCELLEGNVRGTSYTHASPDPGDNYYWVAACNSSGCSQIDGERPARSAGTVPAAPDARFAFEGSSIVLSWDAVAGATFYRVYYDDFFGSSCRVRAGGSTSFCELLEGNVRGTSYTHASPDPGENYYWVAACNSSGCSQIDSDNSALPRSAASAAAPS
ncbi:S8 family serine peptidase [Candidatus Poriferisodalis sp.]|uniref:S8 family serine peptidase n=1 Tax=Candidatus Poriferisodalis sp. TaxID=3101277 RepID=UPI003AF586A5